MATAVVMPKAGITVETCIISKWLKQVGDTVKIGDVLFTYETDKAAFECESTAEGEILEIFFHDGDEVEVLVNVCAVGTKGEDVSALRPAQNAQVEAAAEKEPEAQPQSAPDAGSAAPATATAAVANDGTAAVSPRAKNLARRAGVDPAMAAGSGPYGRVIERDIRRLMEEQPVRAEAAAAPAATAADSAAFTDEKFSGIRRAIAKSMTASLSEIPQLTHHHSFDATQILAYRKLLKGAQDELAGVTLGDIVLYAVSRTLPQYPELNAHVVNGDTLRKFKHVNLGVAIDTPRGLMVPTVFGADEMSLLEISRKVKELAALAREGSISPDLLTGASFTVSNLGNLGVESFTPVINPPQTGILGVCAVTQRVRTGCDGALQAYPAMGLSLTYDHRALDGSPASRFMKDLCDNLEHFTMLLAK